MAKKKDESKEYDLAFNPWIGCSEVDAGCDNCMKSVLVDREKIGKNERRKTKEMTWAKVSVLNKRLVKTRMNFGRGRLFKVVNIGTSMDLFEDVKSISPLRNRLINSAWNRSRMVFLIPTKRPENVLRFMPVKGFAKNIVIGISVCDQESYDRAVPYMSRIQETGVKTYILATPLLEPINMSNSGFVPDWVVAGGEQSWSGVMDSAVRPLSLKAVKMLQSYCTKNSVPFFFKSLGYKKAKEVGIPVFGSTFSKYPKGLEWLKVREKPNFSNWIFK